jgi:hypothetical protein
VAAETISGRVLEDHTGAALALVEIRLLKPGQRAVVAELETDTEGRFRSPDVAAGEYTLEFAKANYGSATLHAAAGQSATVRLVRGGVIAGKVTDPKGQPIPGAKIFTMVKPTNSAVLRPMANVISADEGGQYRIYGLPPGQYGVAVSYDPAAKGAGAGVLFYPNNQRPRIFTVSGGEEYAGTDFAIQPQALFKVSGKVELPRRGYKIELSLASAEQPALSYASMESARDGTFVFEGIAPGSYELFASGPTNGYAYLGATLEPKAYFGRTRIEVIQNVEGVTIAAQPAKAVAVELRGRAAACPAQATVTFSPLEAWHIMGDRSVQARMGEPQLVEQLAPGRYQVTATKLGNGCYQSGATVVDVGAMDGPGPIPVTVAQAGSIRGKLVGATERYAVVLMAEDPDIPVQIALPDAESKFGFAALPPGRYRAAVRRTTDDRWVTDTTQMIELDVAGGAPTDVELPAPAARK